ncbi:hypothetical protein EYF80_064186 [Liparis tanakae]|uniref:Uncharacterized protein n=1 Tax=Liparis tanakae TaxID=230148 RepID=A0A4Z2EAE7_9TELE|nr:hypothetical protein EYF80_064186 [Liparis tanakae]
MSVWREEEEEEGGGSHAFFPVSYSVPLNPFFAVTSTDSYSISFFLTFSVSFFLPPVPVQKQRWTDFCSSTRTRCDSCSSVRVYGSQSVDPSPLGAVVRRLVPSRPTLKVV